MATSTLTRCTRCETLIPKTAVRCGSCGYNNSGAVADVLQGPRLVRLSDRSVIATERYKLDGDLVPLNVTFGGGIPRTSTTLLGGPPGAGKTTVLLQIADALALATDRDVLLVAAEQEAGEIRTNVERIGLHASDRLIIMEALSLGNREELPIILAEAIRQVSPVMVVVDSLPELCGGDQTLASLVLKGLKRDALENRCPIAVLQHVTKGLDMAGLMHHQHVVDGVALLTVEKPDEMRVFKFSKHRFGPTKPRTCFTMTETRGLVPCADPKEGRA